MKTNLVFGYDLKKRPNLNSTYLNCANKYSVESIFTRDGKYILVRQSDNSFALYHVDFANKLGVDFGMFSILFKHQNYLKELEGVEWGGMRKNKTRILKKV